MIIYKAHDFTVYETRSGLPASDWTGRADYVIDETDPEKAELIRKIKDLTPFITLVVEGDKVIDAEDDTEARAAWEAEHPTPETPDEPAGEAVTWDILAAAYKEGVNSI